MIPGLYNYEGSKKRKNDLKKTQIFLLAHMGSLRTLEAANTQVQKYKL